ncbi:MAG: MBL fold metallo-hydrolase [Gammaproteobacteria bacterium]|nr:MBL fold metallo-hydrolase [Gammaproteobacteria bacterium]
MKYRIISVTPFEQNCTLLWCEASMKAAIVDPGGDLQRIKQGVEEEGLILEKILITHAHIDHAGGAAALARDLGIPVEGPQREDAFWIDAMAEQGRMFGFDGAEPFDPDRWLQQGDQVLIGDELLEVRHCPGHTPGHVIFFHRGDQIALVGDVLFKGSIGRSDFPRGDHATLLRSIREQLFTLGDDVTFIPGHGLTSTIGVERQTNPFLT